ncbi:MAG: CPBP family intramembrane metalloprotease, partial [Bacteroidetes bacterium]|nr:CPBP family intramembrane metalloprotease [Bacteroidota bacterium]
MFDETPQISPIRQWLHVAGRLLIMAGMMIFFASVMSLAAMYLIEYGMGINVHEAIRGNLDPSQTQQILALKVFQVLAGSIGMFLLPAYFFPKAVSSSLKNYVPFRSKVYWPLWLVSLALMLVSNPLNAWLFQINQHLSLPAYLADWEASIRTMEESTARLTKVLIAANDIPALLLNIFVVALMPAICEELFFRGVLQNYLRIVTNNPILAILLSAIIFSAFHGQFYGFLPRVMMGFILGMAYNNTAN